MIGVVMAQENMEPNGMRYNAPAFRRWSGQAILVTSVKDRLRCSGTKAPSTTMSLLPVPRRPTVSHTSSMV